MNYPSDYHGVPIKQSKINSIYRVFVMDDHADIYADKCLGDMSGVRNSL